MNLLITGDAQIGDLLMETPAIRAYKRFHPDHQIYRVVRKQSRDLLVGNPFIDGLEPPRVVDATIALHATDAWDRGLRKEQTMIEGFGTLLGVNVDDLRYVYVMSPEERAEGKRIVTEIGRGRPVVICARHSITCTSRSGQKPNKCFANGIWIDVAEWLLENGFCPVAIGSFEEFSENRFLDWPGPKLYGMPLRTVAGVLRAARLTISVDTGIRHLTAAVGGNLYTVSCAVPLTLIKCVPVEKQQRVFEDFTSIETVNAPDIINRIKEIL